MCVAIVHGDAESLAGWGFAQEHLQQAAQRDTVRGGFMQAHVDALTCGARTLRGDGCGWRARLRAADGQLMGAITGAIRRLRSGLPAKIECR